jgi:CRP-like cAMP-binding protein
MKLIDGLQEIKLKEGDFVFHMGDQGHEFYIIEQGDVECLIESGDESTCVRVLG